jgi:putative transposase
MSDTFSRVEVISGVARRRRFSTELKVGLVAETMQPGSSVSYVARRHGLSPSLLFRWRRLMSEGGKEAVRADDAVVAAADDGGRDPQGGARSGVGKKTDLAVALAVAGRYIAGRYKVKTVSATLGVARSNVIERRAGTRPRRGPQKRAGDVELAGAIRQLVDARPTYGYRRIAALLKRERRSDCLPSVNAKRVYRLMKKHGLLLERHTGRRRAREHDGQVTIRSNCRWCSDALEFTCWNGEVVRVAFALECHDREAISWVATTAGISGEMMVRCVERRFGDIRAPRPVQWLSDNGSIFAAHRTIEVAVALNLMPCFTPVESPESNGVAEAFVKPSSATTSGAARSRMLPPPSLSSTPGWRTTTPCIHIPDRATAHPGSTSCLNPLPVRFNGLNSIN